MTGLDVDAVREQAAAALREERRRRGAAGAVLSGAEELELGRAVIAAALDRAQQQVLAGGGALPSVEETDRVAAAVHAAMFGLGRLQPLIDDPELTNIEIIGADHVRVHTRDGRVEARPPVADSDVELLGWVRAAATWAGLTSRPFDPTHPWLEVRLPDGSRLCALMSVVDRPVVSIRLYRQERVFLDDLAARGAFGDELADFLTAAVRARCNLMVSGETFAGKTTLLRALGNAIPREERLVTAEHFLELGFHHHPDLHDSVVAMEERLANSEGEGGVTLAQLVERSRRMNPDRIIVGEVIGAEIIAMLDAMTQGEDGSLSTIHARDARTVFTRIATYALCSDARLPVEASGMLTAGALDFVIHVSKARLPDGRVHRWVSSVREVAGWDGTQVSSSEIYTTPPGQRLAVPAAPVSDTRAERLAAAGHHPRLRGIS